MGIEYRRLPEAITLREDEKPVIEGYFAKFNRWFPGPFFKEKIAPGAFAQTLKDHDIRALWNHNPDFPLGRTRNKTLSLIEYEKGLWGQIDMPDTQVARDALTSVKRGDVSGASFGFEVEEDGQEWNKDFTERTLTKVKLWEVSPVVFPAYQSTHVHARSILDSIGRPVQDVLPRLVERSRSGRMTADDRTIFEAILSQNQMAADVVEDRQEGFQVQTLIFPKAHWDSAADCKAWAKEHDFKSGDVDETEDSYRLRQRDPGDFVRLRTICVNPGDESPGSDACKVKAVGGPVKEGRAHESEPEDPELADRKRLADARCLITLHKLQLLGVIKPR
jgi:Escherichia/Staphylococcus phage prohead protease